MIKINITLLPGFSKKNTFNLGRGCWHTLCVPVRDYWHTPPEMKPMKARVCANCSFLLLAHTLIELGNLEVKASRGKRRILKLVIKASKIS